MAANGKTSGSNTYLLLSDNLSAGFLLKGRQNSRREYAAFDIEDCGDEYRPIYKRPCTREEKNSLKKQIFGRKTVHSLKFVTITGEQCELFVQRRSE